MNTHNAVVNFNSLREEECVQLLDNERLLYMILVSDDMLHIKGLYTKRDLKRSMLDGRWAHYLFNPDSGFLYYIDSKGRLQHKSFQPVTKRYMCLIRYVIEGVIKEAIIQTDFDQEEDNELKRWLERHNYKVYSEGIQYLVDVPYKDNPIVEYFLDLVYKLPKGSVMAHCSLFDIKKGSLEHQFHTFWCETEWSSSKFVFKMNQKWAPLYLDELLENGARNEDIQVFIRKLLCRVNPPKYVLVKIYYLEVININKNNRWEPFIIKLFNDRCWYRIKRITGLERYEGTIPT